ncbi:MAG: aspartate carbamoyltransferase [Candidatus Jacksonbacteria bacterium RIFOXYA2_FULL_44_7]|uniref:Aspartate carbamoyltransferase n=1 Tax=Candidatus Jacksonbacteria bacterium RIFCSPLOWO2_02_FULL_44_20 TaxID=1798460 RepID=A0A1G2ABJ0_9BACT|nr:MAG: Aspartate carbamoyltransferase [Parcubacteria group bacterium GW2011_GWC2_44_17]KKT48635.1 MAG: Aspartate carbamoyltransferase [Parcubacteria group bacterium GW2011_GWF2_44_17]OGY69593.1 MAG: aspartate carbamoyltransferase [Candidatus Jacksonbacteria bacterium RIFCSPHIGHO2_02_FULL_44_25]OGY71974.1 MAG: aspartate carbamoyltransferase [Candidatus Jacksonbacteria bacterium RIFCSPHIGHO2_12_FULL_44_12]OGY73427.1 MAG: aspartate carbamoyltransferase [Candidatus Jacksonbacteria bacterium RIFCSP
MKHILSITDFSRDELLQIIEKARDIKSSPITYCDAARGSIIATLFFEPSTRTRLSFESAALRLGANVLGFADAKTTSTKKGETLEDTIKIVNGYADYIVMRHFETGAAARAAAVSHVPIVNAGDGSGEHPTQALLDIFTIAEKIPLNNLIIAFVGDLKYGRTAHSLSQGLAHFNPKFYFISPSSLRMPEEILTKLKNQGISCQELETWDEIARGVQVLYMTRVQEERFQDKAEYARLKNAYVLNKATAALFKDDCLFMHPLPRVGEINPEIDNDQRAIYFKQAHNGVWVRMALFLALDGERRGLI